MSTLHVENLKGLSSGGNANKVIIPTGQTLEVTDNIRHDDMPTGSIIQAVTARFTTTYTINTQGYTSIGSLAITPKFANSKILISNTNHVYVNTGTASQWRAANFKLFRDSSEILAGDAYDTGMYSNNSNTRFMVASTVQHHDTPNTTNAVTYSIQYNRRDSNTTNVIINHPSYGRQGFILLQEIKQ